MIIQVFWMMLYVLSYICQDKKVGVFPRNFDWANWITIAARNSSPAPPLQAVRSVSFEGLAKTSPINLIYQWERTGLWNTAFVQRHSGLVKPRTLRVAETPSCQTEHPVDPEGVGWILVNPTDGCPDQNSNCRTETEWNSGQARTSHEPRATSTAQAATKRGGRWGGLFLQFLPKRESEQSSCWEKNVNIHDKAWIERTTKYFNQLSPPMKKKVIFPSQGCMDGCTLTAWCSSDHLFRLL